METQTHLGLVERHRYSRSGKFWLVCKQRPDGVWFPIFPHEAVPLSASYHDLQEGTLIFAELTKQREIAKVSLAIEELPRLLREMSLQLTKFKNQEQDATLREESLIVQFQGLHARTVKLEAREAFVTMREQQLKKLLAAIEVKAARLEREKIAIESSPPPSLIVRDRNDVERLHAELTKAWEHVVARTQELEEKAAALEQRERELKACGS